MSLNLQSLVPATLLANSAATLYTVGPNVATVIKKVTVYNSDASARVVTLYLVDNGGSANATSEVVTKSISAGTTLELFEAENHVLLAGGTIQAFADVAAKVSLRVSGLEQS